MNAIRSSLPRLPVVAGALALASCSINSCEMNGPLEATLTISGVADPAKVKVGIIDLAEHMDGGGGEDGGVPVNWVTIRPEDGRPINFDPAPATYTPFLLVEPDARGLVIYPYPLERRGNSLPLAWYDGDDDGLIQINSASPSEFVRTPYKHAGDLKQYVSKVQCYPELDNANLFYMSSDPGKGWDEPIRDGRDTGKGWLLDITAETDPALP